jgi:hypothetical protein
MSSSRRYQKDVRSLVTVSDRLQIRGPMTFLCRRPNEQGQQPEHRGLLAKHRANVISEMVVYNNKGQSKALSYQTLTYLLLNEPRKGQQQVLKQEYRFVEQNQPLD